MGHKSKKCCKYEGSCCKTSGSCDNGIGIGALQALARINGNNCLVSLCVATTPEGDSDLAVRRFPTGAIPGNDIILILPRLYPVLWDRCDPAAIAKPFCQTWLRVCVDGYIATQFLVPTGSGNNTFRVETTSGFGVNLRSEPTITSLDLGNLPEGFIVQSLSDSLRDGDGFLFRHVRVCGWAFAGFLADCKCLERLEGATF